MDDSLPPQTDSEPPEDPQLEEQVERLTHALGNVLMLTVNESMVVAKWQAFALFNPTPADIPRGEDAPFREKLRRVTEALGGPPRLIFRSEAEPPPTYDTYVTAAIQEMLSTFDRARNSVLRTHIYLVGSSLIRSNPEYIDLPTEPHIREILISQVEERFWEHAETSFIRLASHWDRVGQLLDFAFFKIRQFERDGFTAVMDRIHANVAPISRRVSESVAWQALRAYQTDEQPDGLKWLLRRRNLVVHSLHLSPNRDKVEEDPIFVSAYNHLDAAKRKKLKADTPARELDILHEHLKAAAELFELALDLAAMAPTVNESGD
jgi:hypothetical protein